MTEPLLNPPPERIDLGKADDLRDVVHRVVASLAQGDVVRLATEGVHGLVASGLHPPAVQAMCSWSGRAGDGPMTLLLKGAEEVADWVPGLSPLASRVARRCWPGPLTIRMRVNPERSLLRRLPPVARSLFEGADGLAVQVPADAFLRDVLRLLQGPLILRPLETSPSDPGNLFPAEADERPYRLIIESHGDLTTGSSTVVQIDGDELSVLREGAIDLATLTRMAGTIILFVCTGNTCRSPMAEAICKLLLAERLGCTLSELESRGYVVLSAGIAAVAGLPAASNAVEVVAARGGELHQHASRRLTIDLVRQADLILAMTSDHMETLLEHVPEAAPRTRLLHPQGHDVADPIGSDRETYLKTAVAIESYLRHLLDAVGF